LGALSVAGTLTSSSGIDIGAAITERQKQMAAIMTRLKGGAGVMRKRAFSTIDITAHRRR
tara:strand:- start:326 stop:505 length:180 start_codon:yes stop_codon:yes gene_type:complete